jgi:signal peptidase
MKGTDKILFAFVLVGVILIVLSTFSGSVRFLTVLSGSMSPTLNPGDMVVAAAVPMTMIQPGDVISFRGGDEKTLVTHRVVEVKSDSFVVKGDANEDPDPEAVMMGNVAGKMVFSLPMFGYVLHFAKSFWGFLVFIVVPGVLIIVNESRKIKGMLKSSSKSKPILLFGVLSIILLMNFGPTHAYFNDAELSEGNILALALDACEFTNVTKWWSDTEFVPMSDPIYGNQFYIVLHGDGTVSSTNPGGFFININITNLPNAGDLVITDQIFENTWINPNGDFAPHPKIQNSIHLYEFYVIEDGSTDVTKWFTWNFDGEKLTVTLKDGKDIGPAESLYVTFHVKYNITYISEDDKAIHFPSGMHLYSNKATILINGSLYFESSKADLTAVLKPVGPPEEVITGTGYESTSMALTTDGAVEEPVLNETIEAPANETIDVPDNSTIEVPSNETAPEDNSTIDVPQNESDTQDNSTTESNTTESGLNETTPVTYHMEAGPNTFLVPDTWATNALQLTVDYPLILEISYTDAEGAVVTYAGGAPDTESFDIVAGMTITINASEPFDIV